MRIKATEQECENVQINRGLVFWGMGLVTAGAMALAIQSGAIGSESARDLWRLWPIVLIVIGLSVVAARTPFAIVATLAAGLVVGGLVGTLASGWPGGGDLACGADVDELVSDGGSFRESATVALDLNCGALTISTASGSAWTADARYGGGSAPEISSDDSSLRVAAKGDGVFGFADQRQEWDIVLPTDADMELMVDANAASSSLDLEGATFTSLEIDANAGEMEVRLPGTTVEDFSLNANAGSVSIDVDGATILRGSVEMNAGSFELCVPESVVVAITIDDANITFSHNLDERGLSREGNTWRSGDGTASLTLDVRGNAAGFSLNPNGGCS